MQNLFDEQSETKFPIAIIGLNAVGFNTKDSFIEGRTLPWLLDTKTERVWETWRAEYRDLIILDEENYPIAIYNLSETDLNNSDSFNEVYESFLSYANP